MQISNALGVTTELNRAEQIFAPSYYGGEVKDNFYN